MAIIPNSAGFPAAHVADNGGLAGREFEHVHGVDPRVDAADDHGFLREGIILRAAEKPVSANSVLRWVKV
ncbi:hypothetical protein QN382_08140 [Pseudomonas sp. 10B1]|uniref:hypothetical protein n=1 Tax=unclassified Pseudomonas TaxID=196821 RepID=UPI002B22BFFC|nr:MULTISPECIES: hypothetical protein [unclassified Pseudomonas]MEA9992931.1 hypothetical protein [Pseudomonas sp. AA4]MEB0089106.1 hypothetical protein [Pseudomonas sp. RTI1]MEB0125691.1 hypothetical protein [Pseudomonas sp. CCC1.2]MEB0151516.1 hypothetical protein [Pseudomonas sp. CCC4.3]MEB0220520.1 hypothetical protein [Pseudomonas sp. AB12(2023)]